MKQVLTFLQVLNTNWKVKLFAPYCKKYKAVLDFGCGDLSLAIALKRKFPRLAITGIDIEEVKTKSRDVVFLTYEGKTLPFKDRTFDLVISVYVFHHCEDVKTALEECIRVAKKRVVFIEAVPRYTLDIYGMKFIDWLYNIWKPQKIALPFRFYSLKKWKQIFVEFHTSFRYKQLPTTIFNLLPIGKAYIFEIEKEAYEKTS